jgi:predicted NBD/HSP70 family sugar kinase
VSTTVAARLSRVHEPIGTIDPMPGLDPSALRRLNTSVVLRTMSDLQAPISMAKLVTSTSLSRRTIEQILADLLEEGWVETVEPDTERTGAGRPARLFGFRADHALIAAVRIDTFAATAIVTDVNGAVLGRADAPLHEYQDPEASMTDAAGVVRAAVAASGIPPERLRAGAVAAGGTIDERGVLHRLINAPRWAGVDLAGRMSEISGVPFLADNDANLAALAEHWRGAARDDASFVWSILGNRVGLGIVIRGLVHRGIEGAAGEVVEAKGAFSVERLEEQPLALLTSPILEERQSAVDLVRRAERGDADALALVDEYVARVLPLIGMLAWTIAPPLIVLGGGMEVAAELVLPRLREQMRVAGFPDIAVRASTLGAEAPLIGGIRFVLDRLDAELFGPTVRFGSQR